MDKKEQRILRAYDEFKKSGVIDDSEDVYVDTETIRNSLVFEVKAFERDINDAFADNPTQLASHLTKAALLLLVASGASDDEVQTFLGQKKLSRGLSVEARTRDILRSISKTKSKAEKTRLEYGRSTDMRVAPEDLRSLDDTLVRILEQNGMNESVQGSMRLLFGYARLEEGQANLPVVMQLKANAAGTLRYKLQESAKKLKSSPHAKEGEELLYKIINRSRTGFLTVQSLAELVAADTDSNTRAVYTDNVEQNQALIETFVSSAFDVLYPPVPREA